MSRIKSRQNQEICGDCGALDAPWASVNKGILLCTQCCSIHRSLGRHITQVKSLQKSSWHPNQLAMVSTLNNNGANNIWEHTLLENGSKYLKKKPNPKDLIQMKADFIKSKHLQCAFALRQNYEDGLMSVENELGKQLHASVRTPNLETSFRLLVLGADPNYFHDEKGTTPLHVAARSDQKLQVELLLIYGADPTCPDAHGKTPVDYAKQNVNKDLANRLIESQFEVTDTFSVYLMHRKPDHQTGNHFLIPQGGFESNSSSLAKLQKMPNHLFEELAMDIFDEIDRRETEAIWLSCVDTIDLTVVPFLPVDSTLSTTRNQGRQKLARFSTPELKSLVYDILIDTQRRQLISEKGHLPQLREFSQISDDDPLYDSVASDEDYAVLPASPNNSVDSENKSESGDKLERLTKKLRESDSTITDLKAEVNKLRACVESLKCENDDLKIRLSQRLPSSDYSNGESGIESLPAVIGTQNDHKLPISNGVVDLKQNRKNQRPSSMYETREGINKIPNWHLLKNQLKQHEQPRNATQSLYSSSQEKLLIKQCTDLITKCIQQLCRSIQDEDKQNCVACGENVKHSVIKLVSILPKDSEGETIKLMLDILPHLLLECTNLQVISKKGDTKAMNSHFLKIREYAFHLAKYTKEIVMKYVSNNN